MIRSLSGRIALVTGASGGIGRAAAVALADEGAQLCLVGRDRPRLEESARDVAARNPSIQCLVIDRDISTKDACVSVATRCREEFGEIDVLVSVAGGADNVDVLSLDRDLVTAAIEVKLLSTLWLAQLVAPGMQHRRWGRIITVAGSAGTNPQPDNLATSFANVTALGLTRALSDVLASYGITVNVICPGPTETDRWRRNLSARAASEDRTEEEVHADVARGIPAGRIAAAEDVASLVAFLASDRASYIHANAIYLDGGARRGLP